MGLGTLVSPVLSSNPQRPIVTMGQKLSPIYLQLHLLISIWLSKYLRHARNLPAFNPRVCKGPVDDEEDAESQYVQTKKLFILNF